MARSVVAVVGAGSVGLLLAARLARRPATWRVLLVRRGDGGGQQGRERGAGGRIRVVEQAEEQERRRRQEQLREQQQREPRHEQQHGERRHEQQLEQWRHEQQHGEPRHQQEHREPLHEQQHGEPRHEQQQGEPRRKQQQWEPRREQQREQQRQQQQPQQQLEQDPPLTLPRDQRLQQQQQQPQSPLQHSRKEHQSLHQRTEPVAAAAPSHGAQELRSPANMRNASPSLVREAEAAQQWTATVETPETFEADGVGARPVVAFLFVTTKAGDAATAVEQARRYVQAGATVLVPMTNGLGVAEAVRARFPTQPLLVASTTHGATRTAPDAVTHTGRGTTWVGRPNRTDRSASDEQLHALVALLAAAGFDPVLEEDMARRLWIKAGVSCCLNGPAAILHCRNGALADGHEAAALRAAVSTEVAAVMAREDAGAIDPAVLDAAALEVGADHAAASTGRSLSRPKPAPRAARLVAGAQVARRTRANINSMLQDVIAGRPTEADAIYGYIRQRAAAHGVGVPTLDLLHGLVDRCAAPGRAPRVTLDGLWRDGAATGVNLPPIVDALCAGRPAQAESIAALAAAVARSPSARALAALLSLGQLRSRFGARQSPAHPYPDPL